MKCGESAFDILYLIFAIVSGCLILWKAQTRTGKLMGLSSLILGCADAFHLVPRVLNYFVDADFTAALGIGKLVTSVTMTVFYVLLYYVWLGYYKETEKKNVTAAVWIFILLLFLFYIPVTVGAGFVPILGMLMLLKTVCYILLIVTFLLSILKDGNECCTAE